MIEITNLNKYFNKGRKNEIHAINNTSLSLPDSGLVALLGESGCGKTTMLNAIGGLDKVKSGSIVINGKKITRHNVYAVDKIRNLSVGYIFQDYKLIDDMSVFDNVALALKMIGIKDKDEVKVRVEYVLDKVGILRYRKRPASTLSGGERQRVGIARALVKNPDIILADEPTGNLDSKNSVEIMNIIKKISKDRLVILVTHERNLAEFYADRIVEVVDGKVVNDKDNSNHDALNYEIDNVFYLKEFENHDSFKNESGDRQINVYTDGDSKLDVNIIVKNGNIYIQAKSQINVELIDENSSIDVVDDFKKEINEETIDNYDFDMSNVGNQTLKKRYSSINNPIYSIIAGFKKVINFSILRKLLLIGFIFAGMFIIFAVGKIGATLNVEDKDFVVQNKHYVNVQKPGITVDEYNELASLEDVKYILPTDSIKGLVVNIGDYYQTQNAQVSLTGSIASKTLVSEDDIVIGALPQNEKEIVVDKMILDKLFVNGYDIKMTNNASYDSFLGRDAKLQSDMGTYKIAAIVDTGSPSIYVDDTQFIKILKYGYNASNEYDEFGMYSYYSDSDEISYTEGQIVYYKEYEDKITLVDGWNFKSRLPEADYEVLLPDTMQETFPYGKETKLVVNDKKLVVCGFYKSELTDGTVLSSYFTNENMILYPMIKKAKTYVLCTDNNALLANDLKIQGYTAYDSYTQAKTKYDEQRADAVMSSIILAAVMIGISIIEMYLMSRSSFLSRIKEVGTLRAIGAKKFDIYKMFSGEAIAITTFTSLPAMLLMYYIESYLVGEIKYLEDLFYMPIPVLIVTILAVYVFNLLVSWIPVWNTMRKRPAAILARHDVD